MSTLLIVGLLVLFSVGFPEMDWLTLDLATCTVFLMMLFFSAAHKNVMFLLLFLEYLALMNLFSLVFTSIMDGTLPQVYFYLFLGFAAIEAGMGLGLLVSLARANSISGTMKM